MRLYDSNNIAESFSYILEDIWNDPDYVVSPGGKEIKEIRDCAIEINEPLNNIYTNPFRSSPLKYIAAEILFYFAGTNDPTFIENYASLWKNIHNDDGTINSAYGYLLFNEKNEHGLTQYQWVIESLKKDKDSRQAFMHFNKPHHQFQNNKDQVCTLNAVFHIRNNKLLMTINMRSNDVIYGFMTDWAFFSILQHHVYMHLKEYYPELEMGSYTHISHSMHLYEKHYKLVKQMVTSKTFDSDFISQSIPLMNETILNEDGSIKNKYKQIFEPIINRFKNNQLPNYNQVTDNDLINWCFKQLQ